jgi:hypothetical protein
LEWRPNEIYLQKIDGLEVLRTSLKERKITETMNRKEEGKRSKKGDIKKRARQDSNLRPSASEADTLSS